MINKIEVILQEIYKKRGVIQMKKTVKHIKNLLSSYDFWLSQLIRNNDELVAVRRTLEEPPATQYSDQPVIESGSSNPVMQMQTQLELEDKLLGKRNYIEHHLSECIEIISKCETSSQPIIFAKCVKDTKEIEIIKVHNYSRAGIYYLINKEFTKISKD